MPMTDPAAAQLAAASALSGRIAARVDQRMRGLAAVASGLLLGGYMFSLLELTATGAGPTGELGMLFVLFVPTSWLVRGATGRDGVTLRRSIRFQVALITIVLVPFLAVWIALIFSVELPLWVLILASGTPAVFLPATSGLTAMPRGSGQELRREPRVAVELPLQTRVATLAFALAFGAGGAVPPGLAAVVLATLLTVGVIVLLLASGRRWGLLATGSIWGPLQWWSYLVAIIGIDLVILLGAGWGAGVRVTVASVVAVPLAVSAILPGRHGRD